jgi:hypothetical protein
MSKITRAKMAARVGQVVDRLPSKIKALSSNPVPPKEERPKSSSPVPYLNLPRLFLFTLNRTIMVPFFQISPICMIETYPPRTSLINSVGNQSQTNRPKTSKLYSLSLKQKGSEEHTRKIR